MAGRVGIVSAIAACMTNQPEASDNGGNIQHDGHSAKSQVLHTLEELPASLGHVSSGPFGAVSRRDHTSWKSKSPTDPEYWCGRLDSAIGECIKHRPVHHVAVCFGIGLAIGLMAKATGCVGRGSF
jgi:hypothetical protein